MRGSILMDRISKRTVLHFPGFEPLDPLAHHARYVRSARQTAKAWDLQMAVGALEQGDGAPHFDVAFDGSGAKTASRIYLFDHHVLVDRFSAKPLLQRLGGGFLSAARVVVEGGLFGYFRHAWRFGLFFVFPFMLVGLAIVFALALAASPYWLGLPLWNALWSLPLAVVFFRQIFLPLSERLHTLHLFADWQLAVALGRLDDPACLRWLELCMADARKALQTDADEYVISSHSMGSNIAAHVIGMLLEREPNLFVGKRVVFVTLGGALLQCALLRSARVLRARIGLIAQAREVVWMEVQCLTDSIHFYKTQVVALAGHPQAPQARIAFIRIRQMLSADHYRKIRTDFLRVHRQYVLGPDRRASFDFTLLTASPLPASSFADFTSKNLPDL